MDRLQTIVIAFAGCLLLACSAKGSKPPEEAASRVNAVASKTEIVSLEAFCDVRAPLSKAKTFHLPALADGKKSRVFAGWRWTNVWATWCEPCIEEMPMLMQWETKLQRQGRKLDLEFLSVDSTQELVMRFRSSHPETPDGVRISDFGLLPDWLSSLGLDEGATIPIHIITNPSNQVRCVRTGAINETDYPAILEVLSQG